MKVYLAGPISGLTYDGGQDWRNQFTKMVDPRIVCYSPLRGKDYLRVFGALVEGKYDQSNPLSSDQGITARDRFDCMGSDLVVFNLLGAKAVSIGTMIELGWADASRNPAVLIMEREGNPHEHPMVRQTTHFRVDNLKDAAAIVEIILLNKRSVDASTGRPEDANAGTVDGTSQGVVRHSSGADVSEEPRLRSGRRSISELQDVR